MQQLPHQPKGHVSSAKSRRLHMQARSVVHDVQIIPNTREGRLCTGRSSNGPGIICKPLPDRLCKYKCYSNCNGKTTKFVNNGNNINSKFTTIKNMLTTREALSSQDNTQCCCSTMGIQPGVSNPVWCSSQMCHECLSR